MKITIPPAMASIGIGIPYLLKMVSPNEPARSSAIDEYRIDRKAIFLVNDGSALRVIFANGAIILNGPSIKKRKVIIWAYGVIILCLGYEYFSVCILLDFTLFLG